MMVYVSVVLPSWAVTVTVMVFSPTVRSTWWSLVLGSASVAGVKATVALESLAVAATVTSSVEFFTALV